MKYFILFAHPEPVSSFHAAMLRQATQDLRGAGHEVRVSNLYEMNFDPVASARDFKSRRFPDRLQYDREQKYAAAHGLLADDIMRELDALFWCDVFVLQFPLYWFGMPAIMKGWIDRVMVNTVAYGSGKRYETGGLKGRTAMICTATGAYESMFGPDGLLGDLNRTLWPIHNGILFYTGFEVAEPFVAWAPVHSPELINDAYRAAYSESLLNIDRRPRLRFHPLSDFSADFRLKSDVVPISAGHWRPNAEP